MIIRLPAPERCAKTFEPYYAPCPQGEDQVELVVTSPFPTQSLLALRFASWPDDPFKLGGSTSHLCKGHLVTGESGVLASPHGLQIQSAALSLSPGAAPGALASP